MKSKAKAITAYTVTRFIIQAIFFLFLPALFSSAFTGVRYIAERIFEHEVVGLNHFIITLIILLSFTILFGRFFCGYACAFGSLGDWLFAFFSFVGIRIKISGRVLHLLQYGKYIVLIVILAACFTGRYSMLAKVDPWTLFSLLRAGNFNLTGQLPAAILFLLILIGMCFFERFFCQFLCPMGAILALLPVLPFTVFDREKENCIEGCSLCVRTCPAAISLGEGRSKYGDCFQCGKCSAKCPKANIRTCFGKFRGIESVPVLGKAILLFVVCYYFL
ncbi:MAG: 4Fe-4S binding protein [Clostridiales Family XIII bacterium]|jgi:polyferredoxin|nr:4Fe-4S binding protein [Clostridiales Family XIII bacterium]